MPLITDFVFADAWPGLLLAWLFLHLPPAAVVSGPVFWLGRSRVSWCVWDGLAFVIPYFVWASLYVINASGKGWRNLWEAALLAVAAVAAPLLRVAVGDSSHDDAVIAVGLAGVTAIAIGLWWFVPDLGGAL